MLCFCMICSNCGINKMCAPYLKKKNTIFISALKGIHEKNIMVLVFRYFHLSFQLYTLKQVHSKNVHCQDTKNAVLKIFG